ncbi:N-acetylneuraminate synthase family protein [Shewanella kaireitica]|uniref:N-acetylneuraminate synthase family protein n=1 Tax=Shewanella kaireitica TaxID=212021 RepID=UPI0031FE6710
MLQCVSGSPVSAEQYNLKIISFNAQSFDILLDLPGHTIDNATSIAAVALKACLIEKQVTVTEIVKEQMIAFP